MADLEKQRDELKSKASAHDKLQFELKKLQSQLEVAKSDSERQEQRIAELKKNLADQKSEYRNISDQFGNHEDAMAAAEFKAEGLAADLKEAE